MKLTNLKISLLRCQCRKLHAHLRLQPMTLMPPTIIVYLYRICLLQVNVYTVQKLKIKHTVLNFNYNVSH